MADAPEQLARALDAVRGRSQYAFVRLSAPADFDRERVEGDLSQLAAALAAGIRRDLEEI